MNTNKLVQSVLSTVLVTSVVLNMTACYVILVKVKRKEITHLFVVSISMTNLLETMIGLTPQILIADQSLLEKTPLCIASGFIVLGFAITNISHLAMLSFIRTFAIKYPMRYLQLHKMFWCKVASILVCYANGFFWAILPLLGWSKYELDLDKKRCSLDWSLTKANSFSYILTIFIFCNILPGIIIVLTLYFSKKTVFRRKTCKDCQNRETDILEKEYLRVCFLSATAYFLFWTTYAIVSVLTLLKVFVPVELTTTTALVAKLSTISNVLINCYVIKSFRKQLLSLMLIRFINKYLWVLIACKKSSVNDDIN
ncbi:opsin-3 [Hydra vulgaris]|uniref:opsin-3 n=1 Tax=Hydra vulgaris TaxID=6087 RepID=UPI001F5F9B4C|nr:opsin-3-like [Hydra vulgaris]